MVINEMGTYTLTYTAADDCGNTSTATREVVATQPQTYRTVLYTDGTLIINEGSNDTDANVTAHGVATNVYDPLDADHPYVFTIDPDTQMPNMPWLNEVGNVTSVKIGSAIQPTSTAMWFGIMSNCTSMDLSLMDTSNVTDMSTMFASCSSLTSLDVSGFDTSNVTNMSAMFASCSSLTSLDVSGFDTSNVTNMSTMFVNCSSLTSLNVSSFDTSNVTDMTSMFENDSALVTIYASENFVTSNVSDSSDMFSSCNSLVGGNGTVYDNTNNDATYARIDTADTPGYFTAT